MPDYTAELLEILGQLGIFGYLHRALLDAGLRVRQYPGWETTRVLTGSYLVAHQVA